MTSTSDFSLALYNIIDNQTASYNPEGEINDLILLGADVNYRHPKYLKPLLVLAIDGYNVTAVRCLLRHGASPNINFIYIKEDTNVTPLMYTCSGGDKESSTEIAKLLIEHGADISAEDVDGWRPINFISSPNVDLINVFIDLGLNEDLVNSLGNSVLGLTLEHSPEVYLLIKKCLNSQRSTGLVESARIRMSRSI